MCIACIFAGLLTACGGGGQDYTSGNAPYANGHTGIEVTYKLEGGVYQNSDRDVRMYYYIPEGGETLIAPPGEYSKREIIRQNYVITGWFRSKRENSDGTVTYSDEWDFEKDKLRSGDEPLTLYCGWAPKVTHTYAISYFDENGAEQVFTSIKTQEGRAFADPSDLADGRVGFTAKREKNAETGKYEIAYYKGKDASGNWIPWDDAFVHPGGEESTAVKVYVEYLKGDFVYVSTADEFIAASSAYARTGNGVYLTNDVDLGGEEVDGFRNNAGKFTGVFYGNGFTISDFKLACSATNDDLTSEYTSLDDNALCIGFFGILEGATVENVRIEGMTLDISVKNSRAKNVYIAPFAALAMDSVVKDVTLSAAFTVTRLESYQGEEYIVTDRLVWDESFGCENCTVQVTLTDNR